MPPTSPLPPKPEPPDTLLERLADLEAYVARNDVRIAALEAILGDTKAEVVEKNDAMARLEWAVAHGRKRPW